ncbi:hypothetical protein [Escherichia coli]|nr:hypothetical protein FADCJLBI_00061 [Salmonella phage vB_SenS_ST1]HBM2189970.1 hypothetical protein [Escherichia coli]
MSNEFKGTKGAWRVVVGDDNSPDIVADGGVDIASTPTYNGDKDEQWHNAYLIAAAPELLSALQACLGWVNNGISRDAHNQAITAINKALGK